tara:strand:+ start:215 stop:601 length:387 start_codon:yes stop_codon:yes gene_type:complete
LDNKVKDIFVHVAHIENQIGQDVVDHDDRCFESLLFSKYTISPRIFSDKNLVSSVVTIKTDKVRKLEDILDSESEPVEFFFLSVIVLVVHKQSHDLPVGISGVGSAIVGQTLVGEYIYNSVCKAIKNI